LVEGVERLAEQVVRWVAAVERLAGLAVKSVELEAPRYSSVEWMTAWVD